ncbi:hypothetical protein HDC90_005002 [Pedobacter sp. AK013]|nr:hypothetical protein [Pedobacter sp. AK013]
MRTITLIQSFTSLMPMNSKRYQTKTDDRIDFIAFCTEFIAYLEGNGRGKSAANYRTLKKSLIVFFGKLFIV